MSENTGKPVINKERTEVRLGELSFDYDPEHNLLQISIYGEEVRGTAEVWPGLWESFVKDLENKIASGPMLSALQQIRELGKDARWQKVREEKGEVDRGELEAGVRAFSQMGQRTDAIACQVLAEIERTSPPSEDERHVSILEGSSSPRGVAPQEVMAALHYESERLTGQVTVLNWQVTEVGEDRIVQIVYAIEGISLADEGQDRIRAALHVNDKPIASYEVGE